MVLSKNSEVDCTNESKGNENKKDNVSRTRVDILKRSGSSKLNRFSKFNRFVKSNTKKSISCVESTAHSPSESKTKKREFSGEMESNSEETSHKVMKLSDCDDTSNNSNSDMCCLESKMNDRSSSEGKNENSVEEKYENLSEEKSKNSCDEKNENSSKKKIENLSEEKNENLSEEKNKNSAEEKNEKSSEGENEQQASSSTDGCAQTTANIVSGDSISKECEPVPSTSEGEKSSESSKDTSRCDSSSSSDDIFSIFSDSEDEEDDDNFGLVTHEGINSEDEQNSETDDDKLPPVLKKTLPADKFSFPKEILLRQINSGDGKRRHCSNFESKVYGSRRMVQRLELFKSLKKHHGCVNTLSFNDTGNILISASDDKHVSLWNWAEYKNLLHFDSGHTANVFQAKFLPNTNDRTLISCGQDKQVRQCLLDGCGLKSTSKITKHEEPVHKIAMQPQMPDSFLTAGEDGVVYSIDLRDSDTFNSKFLKVHGDRLNSMATICLYSIHCNPVKNYEFIVGGSCEKVRLYDQRNISSKRQKPVTEFRVGCDSTDQGEEILTTVTCAVYNHNGTEILASYNDNDVFLFNSNDPSKYAFRYDGHRNITTIKGVNFFGPRSEFVVSGSDCGYIYIWDKKSEAVVQWMKGDRAIVNCLEPHPSFPVLATSGLDSDVKIWMPLSTGCEDIPSKKEFQKVVKKNLYYKRNNTFTARDQAQVNFFYFLISDRRA